MISDRAKVEQSANRGHVHSNHYVQGHPPEAEVSTRDEPNHHSVHGAESDSESEQLDWDPERVDDDGYPLVDENRSTWVPVPRDGPRWTKPKQVRCQRGHKITGRSGKSARFRHRTGSLQTRVSLLRKKKVRKTLFTKKTAKKRSKRPHTISREGERTQHRTYHRSRTQKRTRCNRCQQLGHLARECQNRAQKDNSQAPGKKFLHARRRLRTAAQSCFLHGVYGCV